MSLKSDLSGQRFHHLVALYPTSEREGSSVVWRCKCDCGREINIGAARLKYIARSCGKCAFKTETMRNRLTVWNSPKEKALASRFKDVLRNCYNSKRKSYKTCGGRGIYVCDEWKNDRSKFVKWGIEHGFEFGLVLDRINPNGPFSPENCRFVRPERKNSNKVTTVHVTVNDVTYTLRQWAILIDRPLYVLYSLSHANKKDLEWYISIHWNRILKTDPSLAVQRINKLKETSDVAQ